MSSFKKSLVALFAFVAVMSMAPRSVHADFHLINSAMAQEVAPSPSPSMAPAAQSVGEKIGKVGDVLGSVADHIPHEGMPITVLVMIVGFVYDFFRRKFPSKDPASLWRDVKAIMAGVKKLLLGAIKLIDSADQFGDQVLGQNVKPPQA